MMPTMTGMDFYEAVARTYPEQAERIIFVSGGAFAPRVRQFLERLPNKCLNKPIDGTQLRSTIDDMVP
jgi:CheY-like chemotaxis protein